MTTTFRRLAPDEVAAEKAKRPDLGFLQITRTGGTYLGNKLGLGMLDPLISGRSEDWHRLPSEEVLSRREHWFVVIRNPYDRIMSEIELSRRISAWAVRVPGVLSIPRWAAITETSMLADAGVPGFGHYAFQTSIARRIKNWIRHENLPTEVNRMMKGLGYPEVDFSDWKPKVRQISEADKENIYNKYKQDFEELGYSK